MTAALDGGARLDETVVTVSVGAPGDTAALGTDYQAVSDFVLTIPEGSASGEATFTLTPVDDGVAEGDEAITVSGSAAGLSVEPAELTLEDDDEASTSVELSVSPAVVSEDGGAQQIAVTAALDGAARTEATVGDGVGGRCGRLCGVGDRLPGGRGLRADDRARSVERGGHVHADAG